MRVKFKLRIPGEQKEVLDIEMSSVPREREIVVLTQQAGADETSHEVHSVTWHPEKDLAIVLLRV